MADDPCEKSNDAASSIDGGSRAVSARGGDRSDGEVVEAEVVERAVERATEAVVRKLIVELRETNVSAPDPDELVALYQYPELYRDYMQLWNTDLDLRWQYTKTDQEHDHEVRIGSD